jgi:hypothetical protein
MPSFNLGSPTRIAAHCDFQDLDRWVAKELDAIDNVAIREAVTVVCDNLDEFVRFPERAILLWHGCDRVARDGKRQKYHCYPDAIRRLAKQRAMTLDARPNGPAIASFLIANGHRPSRTGSSNAWSIHHLYSGKYPYFDRDSTTHAQKHGAHFTQSAGLIAAHPIADSLCDEFPFFSWLLRAKAFCRFGYDPDSVFGAGHCHCGFTAGYGCEVMYLEA